MVEDRWGDGKIPDIYVVWYKEFDFTTVFAYHTDFLTLPIYLLTCQTTYPPDDLKCVSYLLTYLPNSRLLTLLTIYLIRPVESRLHEEAEAARRLVLKNR